MQRISRSLPHRVPGRRPLHRRAESAAAGAVVAPAAPGITTLAPAFSQALPVLDGVPVAYHHELRAERLFDLCAALVREGLGTPETWRQCKENPVTFAEQAILRRIGAERCDLICRNVEYHLQVGDVADVDGDDTVIENGRLALTIECSGAGYLKVGPAVEALEEETEGLGAAFYWMLTFALYRVMRLYNHDDALQYEERMMEYAESDEENKEQYEIPKIEEALPVCIRTTLRHERDNWMLRARRLLRKHGTGPYRSWIERLRKIQRLSRLPLKQSREFLEEGRYDSAPLPSLIVAFRDHDAIVACFDEESQYMLEGSSEPTLGVIFSPRKPEEARNALRLVGRFVDLNHELFQLVEELQEWEKDHAGTHLDREESQPRAA